jgi:hypothetical protein
MELNLSTLNKIINLLVIVLIWFNEELAAFLGHYPRFPRATISRAAQNYPEYLAYRMVMIAGTFTCALLWLVRVLYARLTYKGAALYLQAGASAFGILSGIHLMFSTALIDSGKMGERLHQIESGKFFAFVLLAYLLECGGTSLGNGPRLRHKVLVLLCILTAICAFLLFDIHSTVQEYIGVHLVTLYNWILGLELEHYRLAVGFPDEDEYLPVRS